MKWPWSRAKREDIGPFVHEPEFQLEWRSRGKLYRLELGTYKTFSYQKADMVMLWVYVIGAGVSRQVRLMLSEDESKALAAALLKPFAEV